MELQWSKTLLCPALHNVPTVPIFGHVGILKAPNGCIHCLTGRWVGILHPVEIMRLKIR